MPRTPRVHLPGVLYYVTCRGTGNQPIVMDQKDVAAYVELLRAYKRTHQAQVYAYALLDDQLHLCVEMTGEATISAFMHDVQSMYTKHVNKRHQRAGHVFQDRFRTVVVEKDPYLLRLTRYIHGQAVQAERTSAPEYLHDAPGGVADVQVALAHCGGESPRQRYAEFMHAATPQEFEQLQIALQRPVVGSDDFVTYVRQRMTAGAARPAAAAPALPSQPAPLTPEPVPAAAIAEPLLMTARPVRAHHPVLVTVATVSIIATVVSATFLSAKAMTMAGKRVVVVHQQSDATSVQPVLLTTPRAGDRLPVVELNGTTWELQLTSTASVTAETPQQDLIEFQQGQLKSWGLSGRGFPASNYTLTQQPDGLMVWETMQTGPDGEVATWRGEWDGRAMRGVLTRQTADGQTQAFRFLGVLHGVSSAVSRENI